MAMAFAVAFKESNARESNLSCIPYRRTLFWLRELSATRPMIQNTLLDYNFANRAEDLGSDFRTWVMSSEMSCPAFQVAT